MTDITRLEPSVRWGTAASLAALNDVPRRGERCMESDTGKIKYGDGITAYNSLAYSLAGYVPTGDLSDYVNKSTGTAQSIASDLSTPGYLQGWALYAWDVATNAGVAFEYVPGVSAYLWNYGNSPLDFGTNGVSRGRVTATGVLAWDGNVTIAGTLTVGGVPITGGGSGIASGTSNPGSPATDDLFHRTDLDLLIRYDGTRWVSVQEFPVQFTNAEGNQPVTATAGFTLRAPVPPHGMLLTRMDARTFVQTTSSGTQYWTIALASLSTANAVLDAINTTSTVSDAIDTWVSKDVTLNFVVNASAAMIRLTPTKVSTPGSLRFSPALWYRRIVP